MEAPNEASQMIDVATNETSNAIAEDAIKRLQLIQELNAEIGRQRTKLKRRETDVAKVTAERKLAMGEVSKLTTGLDELHTELENLINGRDSERLPFVAKGDAKASPATNGETAPPPPADDAWRSENIVALCSFGLPPGVHDRLYESGLTTVGALEDWRAADCADPKIRGFGGSGTSTRKMLDDTMGLYWARPGRAGTGAPSNAKPPEGETGGPAASDAANGQPRVYRSVFVGVTPGHIAARAHLHLLTPMQVGQSPELRHVVEHDGRKYVVTQAATELGRDVYALRPLLSAPGGDGPFADGWQKTPGDDFVGGWVRWSGEDYRIGPVGDALFIHDPQEQAAEAIS